MADRFAAAKKAGFDRVELRDPYGMTIPELDRALGRSCLELTAIATPLGDRQAGEYGFMGVPRRIADFREGFELAMHYAAELEVDIIHLMAGIADRSRADKMLTRNLAWAAYNAPDRMLTVGPVSPAVAQGYAIEDWGQATNLIDWIGAPNLSLAFDAACAEAAPEGIMHTWAKYGPRSGYIRLGGQPVASEEALVETTQTSGFEGVISLGSPPTPAVAKIVRPRA